MRLDRDGLNRGSMLSRRGGINIPVNISAYLGSFADIFARFQITQNLSGYPDSGTDLFAVLLQSLAAYEDTNSDVYAGLQQGQLLSSHDDTTTDQAARLQLTQNLKYGADATGITVWGKRQLNRSGLNRQFIRVSPYHSDATSSDQYARLAITKELSGYLDTKTDIYARLPLVLAAYADSGTDLFARLRIGENLAGFLDTNSAEYSRLQLTQNLATKEGISVPGSWGRWQLNRSGLNRRYSRSTPLTERGTYADIIATLQLTLSLSGYLDTTSDVYAVLLQAFAGFLDTNSDLYARLRIGHDLSSHEDTSLDLFARLQLTNYLASHDDTATDQAARLRLDHLLSGYEDTNSEVHAALLLALAAYVGSETSFYSYLRALWECDAYLDTTSDTYALMALTQTMKAHLDTNSSVYAGLRVPAYMKAHLDTVADIYASLLSIDTWTFTFSGTIAAGKTVCVDTRDYTVKNNGINAIASFTGDFPAMFPGANTVIYTDALGSRTVTITISKQDRKV